MISSGTDMRKSTGHLTVCLCLLLFSSVSGLAQKKHDFATNVGYELSKSVFRTIDLSLSQDIRFNENSTNYCRFETNVGADISLVRKKLKAGVSYSFLNKENNDFRYENQHRINAQLTYRETFGKWRLSWRGRFQTTFRDETRGDYKVNPKNYIRNRLQANYKIRFSRFEPTASFEFFYLLNGPEKNRIDQLRSTVGVNYLLSKNSSLEVFLRIDNDIQVKTPENMYMLGIYFKHDF